MKINSFITGSKSLVVLVILVLATTRKTQAQTYTLRQVLDSIETRNPGLQQFAPKTAASFAEADAAKAWMAPSVGVGLSEFPYGGGKDMGGGGMARKMVMLRLEQMFPNFGQQNKQRDYYQSLRLQDQDDSATMKNMLFAEAKMAYYDALVAEKKLAVVDQQQKQVQLLIQISEGRLPYGKASLPEIYKARAKLSDLQSMRVQLEAASEQAVAILNSLMNRSQQAPLQIDTAEDFAHSEIAILQVDSSYILENRSDIHRASDEIHSLRLNKKVVSSESRPTFGINLDNMRMNSGGYMYSAMAMVSVPIAPWFSKGYKSKAKAIDYQIQATRKMQAGQVQEAIGVIQKDWLKLQAAQKDVQIFQQEVIPAYSKAYQSYLNAFSENTGDIYETLMAWDELTMKKMQYWDKISDLLNIRVMLETEMQKD
jgi:outer membrane protein TolC